jgi:hypothetical protein
MESLVWIGALVSLIGLAGIIYCIVRMGTAKRAKLSDDDMRSAIQSIVPINMGALFLSVIGLMLVVVGILLA